MILAIDVGNSETDLGLWDGEGWLGILEFPTAELEHPTKPFTRILELLQVAEVELVDEVVISSVVPGLREALSEVFTPWKLSPTFLAPSPELGLVIKYDPPASAGADRIANALGALALCQPPILIIDIGTATTFDVVDKNGAFIGGAIMPGPQTSANALTGATAQLPDVELKAPKCSIGQSTEAALQSGLVLGYAASVQGLATQIISELGSKTTVIATGGYGELFQPLCPVIDLFKPTLTLDGLVVAASRLHAP